MFFEQGRADVGYAEGNLQTPTPNIDRLAINGVIMDRFYTNSICSPSRAAYMSGKYVFQTGIPLLIPETNFVMLAYWINISYLYVGMAYSAIRSGEPWGLPTKFKILPQFLKELNYTTSFLGKVPI